MTPQQARLAAAAKRFDPVCLVRLLRYLGYEPDDIRLRSHASQSSQTGLIESLEFNTDPRQAIVTLNLGLLGAQSPLPSYFFKLADSDAISHEKLLDFLGYFDDRLARQLLQAVYPELDDHPETGWEVRKRSELSTLRLTSSAVLHWLLQLIFPELHIQVEKAPVRRRLRLAPPILGKARLGPDAVFGKHVLLRVPGRRITLTADTEAYQVGRPWPAEVEQRLQEHVFPLLRTTGVELEIWLVIREQRGWLKLNPEGYLGYVGMQGTAAQDRRIRLFEGRLSDWN